MALRTIAAAAAIFFVVLPGTARAQTSGKTACNDGTTTTATGKSACDGHGGIHSVNSTILHRAPSRTKTAETKQPARVSQAGTPSPDRAARNDRPYEERRGWRWGKHKDEKRDKHDAKRHRVRCRDGRYEEVKERGNGHGKGPEICKHHGGVAHQ